MSSLRVVLLGKTRSGKTASGNTIVGRGIFKKTFSVKSATETCSKLQSEISGRKFILIDTPGLIHTEEKSGKLEKEVKKCVELSLPGPHVFLLVIRLDVRFTAEERDAVEWIQENFGEGALKYTMVLLTHGDTLEEPVEAFLQKNSTLSSVVRDFEGRYHMFNNKSKDRTQVRELRKKIEAMVLKNGGGYYKVLGNWEAMTEIAAGAEAGKGDKEESVLLAIGRGLLQVVGEGSAEAITEAMEAAAQGAVVGVTAAVGATVIALGAGAPAAVGATGAAIGATVKAALGVEAAERGLAEASARLGGTATVAGTVAAAVVGATAMVAAGAVAAGGAAAVGVAAGVAAAAVSGAGVVVGATAVAGVVGGAAIVGGGPIGAVLGGALGAVAGTAIGIIAGLTAAILNNEDLEKKN